MKLILSIFLSITLSPLLAQNIKTCTDTIQVPFGDNKMGEYIGCLNYEGIMDGYGTLRFPDSTIYKGNFVRGKMDDLNGELIYIDGDSYIGGFKNWNKDDYCSRFMTKTYDCTKDFIKNNPVVVHVDGTARPQVVNKELSKTAS